MAGTRDRDRHASMAGMSLAKRVLVGRPLATSEAEDQRLRGLVAAAHQDLVQALGARVWACVPPTEG